MFSIFNVQSVMILDCRFYFVTSYPTPRLKRLYSQSSKCSAKKATILIRHSEKWPESWLILIFHRFQGFLT